MRRALAPSESTPLKSSLLQAGAGESSSQGTATLFSSIVNLVSTMLGSGLVVLPHAFAQAGWALGLGMVTLSAVVTVLACDFISESITLAGHHSFRTIANAALPHFALVADLAVLLASIGSGCIYLLVASDNLQSALAPEGPRWIWLTLIILIVAPLSFIRSIDSLRFTSFASVLMLGYILGLIVSYAIGVAGVPNWDFVNATHAYNGTNFVTRWPAASSYASNASEAFIVPSFAKFSLFDPCPPEGPFAQPGSRTSCHRGKMVPIAPGVLHALGALSLQYACQPNVPAVQLELVRPTRARLMIVYVSSVSLVWLFYVAVALCGYYTFGNNVHTNLLLMYPRNALTVAGTICLAAIVVFSYPLACHPYRASAASLIAELRAIITEITSTSTSTAAAQKDETASAVDIAQAIMAAESDQAPSHRLFVSDAGEAACVLAFLGGTLGVSLCTDELGAIVEYAPCQTRLRAALACLTHDPTLAIAGTLALSASPQSASQPPVSSMHASSVARVAPRVPVLSRGASSRLRGCSWSTARWSQ